MVSDGGSFKAAQAMGAVCAAIAGLAMIACFLMLFIKVPRWAFKTLSGCYYFCFVTELLTFLVLNNDVCNGKFNDAIFAKIQMDLGLSCALAADSHTAIVASILFLALGILITICPTPKAPVISAKNCGGENCCSVKRSTFAGGHLQVESESDEDDSHSARYGDDAHGGVTSTVTETFNPDGTVSVKEETINPDGSKSITITTKTATSI